MKSNQIGVLLALLFSVEMANAALTEVQFRKEYVEHKEESRSIIDAVDGQSVESEFGEVLVEEDEIMTHISGTVAVVDSSDVPKMSFEAKQAISVVDETSVVASLGPVIGDNELYLTEEELKPVAELESTTGAQPIIEVPLVVEELPIEPENAGWYPEKRMQLSDVLKKIIEIQKPTIN